MKDKNLNNLVKNAFPTFYEKFKKINIYITASLFLLLIIYLIVCSFFKNNTIWYYSLIFVFFIFCYPMIATKINCNLTIKKFKQNIYQSNDIDTSNKIIKINHKNLYKKRTNFKEELIKQVIDQLNSI